MGIIKLDRLVKDSGSRNLQAAIDQIFSELTQAQWDEMEPFVVGEGKEGSVGDDWHAVIVLIRKADVHDRLQGAPSSKIKPRLKRTLAKRGIALGRDQRITGYLPN